MLINNVLKEFRIGGFVNINNLFGSHLRTGSGRMGMGSGSGRRGIHNMGGMVLGG